MKIKYSEYHWMHSWKYHQFRIWSFSWQHLLLHNFCIEESSHCKNSHCIFYYWSYNWWNCRWDHKKTRTLMMQVLSGIVILTSPPKPPRVPLSDNGMLRFNWNYHYQLKVLPQQLWWQGLFHLQMEVEFYLKVMRWRCWILMEPPGLGGARYLTFLIMKNGPITHNQD